MGCCLVPTLPLTSPVTEGKFLGSLNLRFPPSKRGTMTRAPVGCCEDGACSTGTVFSVRGTTVEQQRVCLSDVSAPSSRVPTQRYSVNASFDRV